LAPHLSRLVACPTVPDVLLATDADWIFEDVDAALTDDETEVVRVRSGREVGPAVRDVEPGLVVLDLQIGNMGGIATALDLQQRFDSGEVPLVPILLLLDRPADVPMARRTGVQGWLLKPLDAFRLRRAARAVAAGDTYFEPSGLIPA
jgi:DNA-binding NarL/FixJ family response regulator